MQNYDEKHDDQARRLFLSLLFLLGPPTLLLLGLLVFAILTLTQMCGGFWSCPLVR
jgi:hypothetical protein